MHFTHTKIYFLSRFFEWIFRGKVGDILENFFRDRTIKSLSAKFEEEYWAKEESLGLRKDKKNWLEPDKTADKLIAKNFSCG